METSTQLVPESSWRTGAGTPETDLGSVFFQPNRLDVLVHLLAFEHLAGEGIHPASAKGWVRSSDQFAAQDNEPTVGTLAAELLTSPEVELSVSFASGGQLVRGASAAAAAISSGRPAQRRESDDKVLDRSVAALKAQGWTDEQLHGLFIEWAHRDSAAQVVLVDLDAEGADETLHELTCRYQIMYQQLEFVSDDDTAELQASSSGSTQLVCLRATGDSIDGVLDRHAATIRATAPGLAASSVLASLWRQGRVVQPTSKHTKRIRSARRREIAGQVLDRARGR